MTPILKYGCMILNRCICASLAVLYISCVGYMFGRVIYGVSVSVYQICCGYIRNKDLSSLANYVYFE